MRVVSIRLGLYFQRNVRYLCNNIQRNCSTTTRLFHWDFSLKMRCAFDRAHFIIIARTRPFYEAPASAQ
jgi:hypothetical protein